MTLACEDANSKLVEVVIVVDVDDEKRVGNSLLQICFVEVSKLKFRRDFEASWQWTRHGGRAEGRRQRRERG